MLKADERWAAVTTHIGGYVRARAAALITDSYLTRPGHGCRDKAERTPASPAVSGQVTQRVTNNSRKPRETGPVFVTLVA